MSEENKHRIEIDWVTTMAGALAAVSSAVLLSTLGAAGTLLGAAVGSAVASVGSSLYGHGLARSRDRMASQWTLRGRANLSQAGLLRVGGHVHGAAAAHPEYPDERLDLSREEFDAMLAGARQPGSSWRDRVSELRWKRVAVAAASLFAVAVMAITAFELIVGQPVSSFTGGGDSGRRSSIGGLAGGSDRHQHDHPAKQPNQEPASSDLSPVGGEPSSSPSPSSAPSSEPSSTPTVSPSSALTVPSPTTTPTEPETSPPDAPTSPATTP